MIILPVVLQGDGRTRASRSSHVKLFESRDEDYIQRSAKRRRNERAIDQLTSTPPAAWHHAEKALEIVNIGEFATAIAADSSNGGKVLQGRSGK